MGLTTNNSHHIIQNKPINFIAENIEEEEEEEEILPGGERAREKERQKPL